MIDVLRAFSVFDIIDIAIISYIVYRLLLLIRGTRAIQMLIGVILLIVFSFVSNFLGLKTTSWVLSNFTGYLFISIIVLFQPEIRRALAFIGETRVFSGSMPSTTVMMEEIIRAVTMLANRQIGALIVLQRETDLAHYVQLGQKIGSSVSRDLLISIFIPYSPLHDGAVIVSDGQIAYAGCILPLTKRVDINKQFGTRHRAGIGVTEETDAVTIIVSEERGSISVAVGGKITSEMDAEMLRLTMENLFGISSSSSKKDGEGGS